MSDSILKNTKSIPAGSRLTVIIRDDGPLIFCGDSPSYRRVTLDLTDFQINRLHLQPTRTSGTEVFFEAVSQCFLEDQRED